MNCLSRPNFGVMDMLIPSLSRDNTVALQLSCVYFLSLSGALLEFFMLLINLLSGRPGEEAMTARRKETA